MICFLVTILRSSCPHDPVNILLYTLVWETQAIVHYSKLPRTCFFIMRILSVLHRNLSSKMQCRTAALTEESMFKILMSTFRGDNLLRFMNIAWNGTGGRRTTVGFLMAVPAFISAPGGELARWPSISVHDRTGQWWTTLLWQVTQLK